MANFPAIYITCIILLNKIKSNQIKLHCTLSNSQCTNIPSISIETEGSRIRIVSETYNLIESGPIKVEPYV